MLGLFSRSTADHPLASAKEAQRIASELSRQAPAKALDEAAVWFESLAGIEGLGPAQRLERIIEIATAALPHARRQAREFMFGVRQARTVEQQHWRLGHDYWLNLGHALERCLADADALQKAAEALRPRLPALLTALLMAYGGQLRWQRLRHGKIADAFWGQLGQIYLRAVREDIASSDAQPFDVLEGSSSPAREYLKAQLLHASSSHSLSLPEIALAERIASRFLPQFSLRHELGQGALLWVDAGKPMPPTRLTQLPEPTPGLRFIGGTGVLPALQQLRATLAQNPEMPADLGQGATYAPASVQRVFDHLVSCWSPSPPMRKHARHRVSSRASVIGGLSAVSRLLAGTGDGLDGFQSWQVEDISQGGLSVGLQSLQQDWIRVGALIGYQPEGSQNWLIGIMRRFAREDEIHGRAGIETLSKTPRMVTAMDNGLQTDLILLDALQDDSSIRVLLAPGHWEGGSQLVTLVDGNPWRLHADEALETTDDWLIGRCIVERLAD